MAENFAFINESAEDDDRDAGGFSGNSPMDPSEDDYYSYLNLPRDAKPEEITFQYRKLSKSYHPDKHQDPENKAKAEMLFGKIKLAYEVLMDPEKRALYDTLGAKALEAENQNGQNGMELVLRYKTPQEIREEFERQQREREERMMEKVTNPKGQVTVNINAAELFTTYDDLEDEEYYNDVGPYIELTGFHFFQSIEAPITVRDTLTMSGAVSAENGRGKGNINFGWRKCVSNRAWGEAEVGGSTNGLDFGIKGYSQLGSRYFTNFHVNFQSTPEGIRPALVIALGSQLDSKSSGTLTWRAGTLGGLQTQYTWENSVNRFVASFHLGIPHSYAGIHASYKPDADKKIRLRGSIRGGTFGFFAEYGIDKKISSITTLSATMMVGIPLGVSLRIKVTRSNQVYLFPIHLSDQVLPAPVVYGTITPLVLWIVVNKLFVEPYEKEKEEREKAKLKAQYKSRMAEKKAEADAAVQLMRVTCSRNVTEEEKKNGLIISSAKYGCIISTASSEPMPSTSTGGSLPNVNEEVIDVTIPLQCLVKDSKLTLYDTSKSQLPGFYDPAPGENKQLKIQYLFQNKPHEVVISDQDSLCIPKTSHRLPRS